MIPDSFIQELLARVDVADVVGQYVQLRKGGVNLLGLCPFHNEKSPSFTVSPTKQFYHCFGCGAHGSAITFLMEHTGANFPEAVRTLATAVGMRVPEEERSPQQKAATARRKEEASMHTRVLQAAQNQYLAQLKETPAAIRYLKQRGLTGEVARDFGLGWSGTDRQGLAKVFQNYNDPVLVEAGLVIESEDGRRYDRFRERIMFPIRNIKGELIGFGGRIIGKGEPKYLNSPETPVFSKGNELYGLYEGSKAIRKEGCVIVVEGYMDVVGLAQLGIANAVATLGTATTPMHIQKLLRASDKIIFSFDGDKAGRRAAWRALQTCLPLLRDDISIRFLFLPSEHDPDSYIRQFGEEAFRACLSESDALSTFFLNELASHHKVNEVEGRSALVHEAKPLLALIPEITLKVQLQNELARLTQLTPEELSALIAKDAPPALAGLPAANARSHSPSQDGIVTIRESMPFRSDTSPDGFPDHYSDIPSDPGQYVPDDYPYGDDAPVPEFGRAQGQPSGPAGQISGSAAVPGRLVSNSLNLGAGLYSGQGRSGRFGKGFKPREEQPLHPSQRPARRTVTPMARRLLSLLLSHPELVDEMGDQQLEVLARGPHLDMVRDLVVLAQSSGARHIGALIAAAGTEGDLGPLLSSFAADVMSQESLPSPQIEWEDALRRIELQSLRQEQEALIASGLNNLNFHEKYRELSQRISRLMKAIESGKSR